jgi:hypothetical protein
MAPTLDPATVSGAVVWGIVAGVATSAILFLGSVFVAKVLIPWYQAITYQGVDLTGTWVHDKNLGGIRYDYVLTLTQRSHALAGNLILKKTGAPGPPAGDYVQAFDVVGSSWEGFVTLNMKSTNRRSLSFATTLLQIQNRGESLEGYLAYRASRGGTVGSEAITFTRQGV